MNSKSFVPNYIQEFGLCAASLELELKLLDEWTSCLGEAVRISSVLEATIVQSTEAALAPQSVSLKSEYYDYKELVRNFRLHFVKLRCTWKHYVAEGIITTLR